MKKIFLTMLLFTAVLSAQSKFIEVEVGDTITLTPERFEYVVNIYIADTSAVDEDGAYDVKGEKEKYDTKIEELKKLLKKEKYNFRPIENVHQGEWTFYTNSGFIINLTNAEQLKQLQKVLEKLDYVRGSLGEVKYANVLTAEELLYKKLLEKAKAKAAVIASASGIKSGAVISVREGKDISDFNLNIHDTYFESAGNNLEMHNGKLVGSLYKKLIVRFEAE